MKGNCDFEDPLRAFNADRVDYLVVGAYAVALHARPRASGDIDVWVESTLENARRIFRALTAFGALVNAIDDTTFAEADIVFQTGVPSRRIDVLTGIDGVSFAEAWPNRVASNIGVPATHVLDATTCSMISERAAAPKILRTSSASNTIVNETCTNVPEHDHPRGSERRD